MRLFLLIALAWTLIEVEMPTVASAAEWCGGKNGKCSVRAGGCVNGKCKRPVRR